LKELEGENAKPKKLLAEVHLNMNALNERRACRLAGLARSSCLACRRPSLLCYIGSVLLMQFYPPAKNYFNLITGFPAKRLAWLSGAGQFGDATQQHSAN